MPPVPSTIADLYTNAADNYPRGSDVVSTATGPDEYIRALSAIIKRLELPVGSIYTNASNDANPETLLGYGTWVPFGSGRVLVGLDATDASFDVLGETGGSKNATLVSHTHTFSGSGSAGPAGGHAHSINDPGHTHADALTLGSAVGAGKGIIGNDTHGDINVIYPAATNISVNAVGDHTHSVSVSGSNSYSGVSGANANLQPYVVVHMWRRTA